MTTNELDTSGDHTGANASAAAAKTLAKACELWQTGQVVGSSLLRGAARVITGLPSRGFAGRGLKPNGSNDAQILRNLSTGEIAMPLWGVSLDRDVAGSFGAGFLFEIVGPFPAIAAWTHSGIKAEEQELIAGGRYRVESIESVGETTHARFQWVGPVL